jgi:hypothetical protein
MSLTECSRCGYEMGTNAATCPHCGAGRLSRRFFYPHIYSLSMLIINIISILFGVVALVALYLLFDWSSDIFHEGRFWERFALSWVFCWAIIFAFIGLTVAYSFADGGLRFTQCLTLYPAYFITIFALLVFADSTLKCNG